MTRRPTEADAVPGDAAAASLAAELPDPVLALVVVVLWVATGLVVARLLAARGHEFRSIAGLAGAMGPLFLPLAIDHWRHQDPLTHPVRVSGGPASVSGGPASVSGGPASVSGGPASGRRTVVLLAGDPERAADALPVLRRLADPGAVTLAVPVGFSTLRAPAHDVDRRAAERRVQQAAVLLHEFEPSCVLAPGTPGDAVATLTADERDIVLVVGEFASSDRATIDRVGVPVVAVPRSGGR